MGIVDCFNNNLVSDDEIGTVYNVRGEDGSKKENEQVLKRISPPFLQAWRSTNMTKAHVK